MPEEAVWYLKEIRFGPEHDRKPLKIVTQSINEPSSFVVICNILILHGNIEILPSTRTTASYEYLSKLITDYAAVKSPNSNISAALSATLKAIDLNPRFADATSFTSSSDQGLLEFLNQIDIKLVHGWLTDPQAEALIDVQDYDSAVAFISEADHIANGKLVSDSGGVNNVSTIDPEDENLSRVQKAVAIRQFLQDTRLQLSYHGLFHLPTLLEPDSVVALFRNSKLSVLYKPSQSHMLHVLVTDQAFLNEPSIVWDQLNDIDGEWSTFVDSNFVLSHPEGGDLTSEFATQGAGTGTADNSVYSGADLNDEELARKLVEEEEEELRAEEELKAEEEEYARQIHLAHDREIREEQRRDRIWQYRHLN